ncbi:MAG: metalloregulator ArsR/SmtB family transcription factor [Planctomycetes bacterium]|nr:metalloregulator ArsR/SmtB family transcription factor [Planctomycetota bacterium]
MATLDDAVRIGKALSDRTRVRILAALTVRPLCVCEITALVPAGQPAVSRHLGILRAAGLVEDVRDGRWVNYRLRRVDRRLLAGAALRCLSAGLAGDPDLRGVRDRARTVCRTRLRAPPRRRALP